MNGNISRLTQLIGNDGLYRLFIDSLGRASVNANITFPEAIYSGSILLSAGGSEHMNVNGSVTPVDFSFAPTSGVWYVETITINIADNTDFSVTGFGGLSALTNGLLVSYKTKGTVFNAFTAKTNAHIFAGFNESPFFIASSSLLGTNNLFNGSVKLQQRIVLDASFGDYFKATVRDNLTGLVELVMAVRIWKVN